MSEKSARFWSGIGIFLAKKIFGNVNQVLAVDPKQADLFKRLGAKNIKSLTSLKSIAEKPIINQNYIHNIKKNLVKKKILLAASTHPGEEELMIKLANLLRQNADDKILIIIAPRHIKRSLAIQNLVKSAGFDIKSRSKGEFPSKTDQFYLSDTMGEMGSLIEVADLVYVAGSMVPVGGHSPSEASQFGKPVVMGPHSEKCNAQIKDLVLSGGAIQIEKNLDMNVNFINQIIELLNHPERLEDMGKNSLIASGYAQQRADEASLYLLDFLKMKSNKHEKVK
jgi:3-deoxy-D-manno-octulosonic-acid transferase